MRDYELTESRLRQQLHALLKTQLSNLPARAWAMGFPVIESSLGVKVRVTEPVGLAERRLLFGVQRFGPVTPERLNDLLGLGTGLIQDLLWRIAGYCEALHEENGMWRLTSGVDVGSMQEFSKDVVQMMRFVVNGLTGRLMPVKFWEGRETDRLFLDPSRTDGPLLDSAGRQTAVILKFADRNVQGESDLELQIREASIEEKERLGIPINALQRTDEVGDIRVCWLPAFLMLREDGTVAVFDTDDEPELLTATEFEARDYWKRVLAGTASFRLDQFTTDVNGDALVADMRGWWPAEAAIEYSDGVLLIRATDPVALLNAETGDGTANDSGRRSLQKALVEGIFWHTRSGALQRVMPGDMGIAVEVCLLRAVGDLARELRTKDSAQQLNEFDLNAWWRETQKRLFAESGWEYTIEPIPVQLLIARADRRKDTEFREKVERIAP